MRNIPSALERNSVIEFTEGVPVNLYSGFNTTDDEEGREPIDQIQAFIAASRIQEANREEYDVSGGFFPFVAGGFEALNAESPEQSAQFYEEELVKDREKASMFEDVMDQMNLEGESFTSDSFWSDPEYWRLFDSLFEEGMYTIEGCREKTLHFKEEEELERNVDLADVPVESIPEDIKTKYGDMPAMTAYTPAEVAEALYLRDEHGANMKVGPVTEAPYDEQIKDFMDILHLSQPTDMTSSEEEPFEVTPYIAKEGQTRIFFGDSEKDIARVLESTPDEEYIFTEHEEVGKVLNPVVEKAIYATETARATDDSPVEFGGESLYDTEDVIKYAQENGVSSLREDLPGVLEENITRRFNQK